MKQLTFLIPVLFFISCQTDPGPGPVIEGELKQWHKVTLLIPGPETSEYAEENPFLDYRLEVRFTNGTSSCTVPGFYAADGRAGESSARQGAIWKVHFRPR